MENYLFLQFRGERKVFKIAAFVSSWYHISVTKYGIKIPVRAAYL